MVEEAPKVSVRIELSPEHRALLRIIAAKQNLSMREYVVRLVVAAIERHEGGTDGGTQTGG